MIENKRYPYIWLLPLTGGRRFLNDDGTRTKTWNVSLVFLDLDREDSNEKQTADIHDKLDVFVDRYLEQLDTWYLRTQVDEVGTITIRGDNQIPFYKDDTDITSGWLVTLTVTLSDNWEYCTPENIDLYAGRI
jgi:hypothetical protein